MLLLRMNQNQDEARLPSRTARRRQRKRRNSKKANQQLKPEASWHPPESTAVPSARSDAGAGPTTPDVPGAGTNAASLSGRQASSPATPLFPQGSNDVLEVLCSGEPTAGKILMHFMLFYGKLYDSQSTSIDVRGTHHPDYHKVLRSEQRYQRDQRDQRSHMHQQHQSLQDQIDYQSHYRQPTLLSPFIPRKAGGSIDPISGMYTVDPIVIYDPLEGAESNNVAKSCFAWGTIRNVFAQCYMTLSGAVERGVSSSSSPAGRAASSNSRVLADISSGNDKKSAHQSNKAEGASTPNEGGGRTDSAKHELVASSSPEQRANRDAEETHVPGEENEQASSAAVDGGSSVLALLLSF